MCKLVRVVSLATRPQSIRQHAIASFRVAPHRRTDSQNVIDSIATNCNRNGMNVIRAASWTPPWVCIQKGDRVHDGARRSSPRTESLEILKTGKRINILKVYGEKTEWLIIDFRLLCIRETLQWNRAQRNTACKCVGWWACSTQSAVSLARHSLYLSGDCSETTTHRKSSRQDTAIRVNIYFLSVVKSEQQIKIWNSIKPWSERSSPFCTQTNKANAQNNLYLHVLEPLVVFCN